MIYRNLNGCLQSFWKLKKCSSTGLKRKKILHLANVNAVILSSVFFCFFFIFGRISPEAAERIRGIMKIMSSTSEQSNTCTSLTGSAGMFHSLCWRTGADASLESTHQHFWGTLRLITFDSSCESARERLLGLAGGRFRNTAEGKQDNLMSGMALSEGCCYREWWLKQKNRQLMSELVVCKTFVTHPTKAMRPWCYW